MWASYHTVMHIVNIQWSTCFLEIGLLLYMKCKQTPLPVTENGINLDAWSLISSPHCFVSIIMQTLENTGVFFFTPSSLELLLILGKQLQIQRRDRNSVSQICKIHFLFLIWKNGEQITDSTCSRWRGTVDIHFGTHGSCSTTWDFNFLLEQV